jgi:hypothetical protein
MVHVGVDLDKRSSQIAVLTEDGEVAQQRLPNDVAGLEKFFALLRWVLVLAATQAIRRPGPLRTWFHAVKKRRGKKVARVALARRLAEIVFHVWKHECDYFTVVRHGVVRG